MAIVDQNAVAALARKVQAGQLSSERFNALINDSSFGGEARALQAAYGITGSPVPQGTKISNVKQGGLISDLRPSGAVYNPATGQTALTYPPPRPVGQAPIGAIPPPPVPPPGSGGLQYHNGQLVPANWLNPAIGSPDRGPVPPLNGDLPSRPVPAAPSNDQARGGGRGQAPAEALYNAARSPAEALYNASRGAGQPLRDAMGFGGGAAPSGGGRSGQSRPSPSYDPRNYTAPSVGADGRVSEGQYVGPGAERPQPARPNSLPAVAKNGGGGGGYLVPDGKGGQMSVVQRPGGGSQTASSQHANNVQAAQNSQQNSAANSASKPKTAASGPTMAERKQNLAERKQNLAEKKQRDAERNNGGPGGGGGGGGGAPKKKEEKPKPKPAPKSGGGGRGGGGGGKNKSPEQRAREEGRYERTKDRENRRTAATKDRRDREEEAKSKGYNNVAAMEKAEAWDNWKKGNEERRRNREGGGKNNNSPGGDPTYGPGTPNNNAGNEAAAEGMYNAINNIMAESMNKENNGSEESPEITYDENGRPLVNGRKMTHKYGNKYAGLTRARGDLG